MKSVCLAKSVPECSRASAVIGGRCPRLLDGTLMDAVFPFFPFHFYIHGCFVCVIFARALLEGAMWEEVEGNYRMHRL